MNEPARPARHVILVSVDGLRADAVTAHSPQELPNFYRLRAQGAFTDNARTDYDYSITLPNHMSMLTGRGVTGPAGHNWTSNKDPRQNQTLHSNKGAYVASVFDVAHDNGLRTGVYASKSKFVLLDESYNAKNGAPDITGADNGRDKIDEFLIMEETSDLVPMFVQDMEANPFGFAFVHLNDPDLAGHTNGWTLDKESPYMQAVRKVDGLIGEILNMVENDPNLSGNTTIIVTADHGGEGREHGTANNPADYTVPFYVWGTGAGIGDLYAMNTGVLQNPGTARPDYDAPVQPLRNSSAGNLALSLLSLKPIPNSRIDYAENIRVNNTSGIHMADARTNAANTPANRR